VVVTLRFSALLLTIALVLGSCGEPQNRLLNGDPAPGFLLERLEGGQARFPEQYRGRVVAIRFWADWCPFCEGEMKLLEPVYRKYRERGLTILAVNVRQDRATAREFIEKLAISYDTLLDLEGEVARSYGVNGLPTTFIIDGNGVLRNRIIGESTPDTFEKAILAAMESNGPASTQPMSDTEDRVSTAGGK
jgi:peroxiredoxin